MNTGRRHRVGLYYRTVRHLRPLQVIHRLRFILARRILLSRRAKVRHDAVGLLTDVVVPSCVLLARRDASSCLDRANEVRSGRFRFVGEELVGAPTPDWDAPGRSRLFRFHLHYFDFAFDLAVAYSRTSDHAYFGAFRRLAEDWLERHRRIRGDAWHPYPTSRRIVNWTLAVWLLGSILEEDAPFRQRLIGAIYEQTRYLSHHLEWDVLANHLFENLRALFVASHAFGGRQAMSWRQCARRLLREQLEEQILDDGGHYERSPTYHCQVLHGVLDCLAVARQEQDELASLLEEKAGAMVRFLRGILFPDGSYPLFNDGAFDLAPTPSELFDYAVEAMHVPPPFATERGQRQGIANFSSSGYAVMKKEGALFIMDAGPLGPSYQVGHGHCDLLSYELMVDGELLVADSGTPTYDETPLRMAARGGRAHNTVVIDEQDQAEIWKSFRVGRRPKPLLVQVAESSGIVRFTGEHDAYDHLAGSPSHRRSVFLLPGRLWMVIDHVHGEGVHLVESYMHLHPDVKIDRRDRLTVSRGDVRLQILTSEGLQPELMSGFRAENIGRPCSAPVLVWRKRACLPITLGYLLAPVDAAVRGLDLADGPSEIRIDMGSKKLLLSEEDDAWQVEESG